MTHPAEQYTLVFRRRDGLIVRNDVYLGRECGVWDALVAANWYDKKIHTVDAFDKNGKFTTGFSLDG